MKRKDIIFASAILLALLPFFLSDSFYVAYLDIVKQHALVMSFVKFAILATLGELIGLRITQGVYYRKGFGVLPRAFFWGVTGVTIKIAFVIFASGTPVVIDRYLMVLPENVLGGGFSGAKLLAAFAISTAMNLIFAPVFMTLHKISDLHIEETGGTLRGYFSKIDLPQLTQKINWSVMWSFVFAKTIPLFWIPAHTVTFLLPPQHRVLFAAVLGVILGVIMALSSLKKST